MNHRRLPLCLVPVLAGCFGTAGSEPPPGTSNRTFFVALSNNTGVADGGKDTPFLTIADALAVAKSGDTIRVTAGTYAETLCISEGVHLLGDGASVTILQGDGVTDVTLVDIANDTKGVVIEGLTFTGGFSHRAAVLESIRGKVTIRRCLFTGNATGDGSQAEIFTSGVVRLDGGDYRIEQCVFLGNASTALNLPEPGKLTVKNTILAMQTAEAIALRGDPSTKSPDLVLENVTVFGSGEDGLEVSSFGDARITNVIFSESDPSVFESQTAGDPVLQYNLLEAGYRDFDLGTTTSDPAVINGLDPPGTNKGNIVGDPLFVDENAGDYHLRNASPCRNTGSPSILDADRSRSDMGAFGGPDGDFDDTFSSTAFSLSFAADTDLSPWLDADPQAADGGRVHRTDLNADGRMDELVIRDGRLGLWIGTRPGRRCPWPVPPGLDRVARASTFDVDGDGRLDLLVDQDGLVQAYPQRAPGILTFELWALPGDEIEVRLTDGRARTFRRTLPERPDCASGSYLFGLGRTRAATVRVLRDAELWIEFREVMPGARLSVPAMPDLSRPGNDPGHAGDGE